MNLESGPAGGDRNYFAVLTIACIAMAAWFFVDGSWRYVKKNRAEATKTLAPNVPPDKLPQEFGPTPTKPQFERLQESNPQSMSAVREGLGTPDQPAEALYTQTDASGITTHYFVSDYGMATVRARVDRVEGMIWTKWKYDKEAVQRQFAWGLLPLLLALYAGYRVFAAVTLKVVIDENGMVYGRERIPFESMKSLRDYTPKGWVDLYYERAGVERKRRIDNQKVARFDEIIDALCQAKGFEDPRGKQIAHNDENQSDASTTPVCPRCKEPLKDGNVCANCGAEQPDEGTDIESTDRPAER